MSMIINHDVTSLISQRMMQRNSLAIRRSLEKLSSGLRTKIADIDNTAGLAISETMRSRIGGMDKALINSQDGISLIQTATGALDQTQSMLQRMRELSMQAANDTLTQQDRSYIQAEINEIRSGITLLAETTQCNRKRILNGDNAVLWSSTDKNVKAVIHGGLRSVDKFGQKYAVDGNFKLQITSEAGKAQVQKSDIFHVKHDDVVTQKSANVQYGVNDVSVRGDIPAGAYNLVLSEGTSEGAKITGSYGLDDDDAFDFELSEMTENASILFEVVNVDEKAGTATLRATANILSQEGVSRNAVMDNILVSSGGDSTDLSGLFGSGAMGISVGNLDGISEGATFAVSVSPNKINSDAIGVDITHTPDYTDPLKIEGGAFGGDHVHYVLDGKANAVSGVSFVNFSVDRVSGQVSQGSIVIETNGAFRSTASGGNLDTSQGTTLVGFQASYVGKIADGGTRLRDIDKFWDAQGMMILDKPKELTLTQGDGKQAKITLCANDTLDDVAAKLNRAIAVGLGQGEYVDDASKFVSFVDGASSGMESVAGTFVIRSVLAGKRGEITLSGNEDVLKALSLNTIQESEETRYNVTVRDVHTDTVLVENEKITGSRLVGVIHENVDVDFDPMLGVYAAWDDESKNYSLLDNTGGHGNTVIIHLADNTTVFQTGADEGDDVLLNLGDMRSEALGINSVNVMSQQTSAEAIGIIDKAIDRVSMQQAKLGAAQNRLEHHVEHLTKETEALIDANSHIQDTDYAKEILEFTKMSIIMQSNTAMLAQANQIQQGIMMLLR